MEARIIPQRVMMGILAYKQVSSIAFSHLMMTLLDGVNSGYVTRLDIQADMYVSMARNNMVRAALELQAKREVTHLLFLDDDMLLPPGSIQKLADTNVPVVGGCYFTRDLRPVAYEWEPEFRFLTDIPGEGLITVGGTGCGCLLIHCDVFRQMNDKYHDEYWFHSADDGAGKYLGEDVWFFRRLKEMGIATWINCNVQCGHAGTGVVDYQVFKTKQRLST